MRLCLNMPQTYSDPRPRSVIVFRDGNVVHWERYAVIKPAIYFTRTVPPHPQGSTPINAHFLPASLGLAPLMFVQTQ